MKLTALSALLLMSVAVVGQKGVYITPGAQVVCVGNPTIVLKDVSVFENRGTFEPGTGLVEIQNNTTATILRGTNLKFHNLTVNSTRGVNLGQNLTVNNSLTLTKGNLNLKNRSVQLGVNAKVVGEAEGKRLMDDANKAGVISITQALGTTPNVNPGQLGFRVVSCAAPFGVTTVKRYCGVTPINGVTTGAIRRFYKVNKRFNTGLNATISFGYLIAELNGVIPSSAVLWRSADNGATWSSVVPDVRDTVNKFLQISGLNSFPNMWTIGTPTGARMPMIVEAINVKGTERGNDLFWTIEEDYPFDYFVIQKSKDQNLWSDIGTINANEVAADYCFNDPFNGDAYYRLRQYGKDGHVTFSKVVKSETLINQISIALYPNPAKNQFQVTFDSPIEAKGQFTLIASSGSVVRTIPVMMNKGANNISMNVRGLPPGTYMLVLKEKGLEWSRRVVLF